MTDAWRLLNLYFHRVINKNGSPVTICCERFFSLFSIFCVLLIVPNTV